MDAMSYGIGLRRPHFDDVLEGAPGVDFLEVLPENFMAFGGRARRALTRARERWPVVLHGVSMSIGGPDPLDESYLASLREIVEWIEPPWFSDHLSYSRAHGVEYHDLIPLPFTEEAIRHVVERVQRVQDRFRIPFLLENPSYYVAMPNSEMTEAEFVSEVVRRSDCGLLLDVNNVWVNATNHGYNPYAFIDALPLARVRQLHLAGHDASGLFVVDTHGASVTSEVLSLFRYTLERTGPAWTLLEWDNNIPTFATLLAELAKARRVGDAVMVRAA